MSNMQEQVVHWLIELGQMHGEAFKLDDDHQIKLSSENHELVITAPSQSEQVYFTVVLCDLPAIEKEAVFEMALNLNLHQEKTRGATIAIDPIANAFVMCFCTETINLSFNDFNNMINNLLETSEGVANQLESSFTSGQDEMLAMPTGLSLAVKP